MVVKYQGKGCLLGQLLAAICLTCRQYVEDSRRQCFLSPDHSEPHSPGTSPLPDEHPWNMICSYNRSPPQALKQDNSQAGSVDWSLFVFVSDVWITLSLSHQIPHYIQLTKPKKKCPCVMSCSGITARWVTALYN